MAAVTIRKIGETGTASPEELLALLPLLGRIEQIDLNGASLSWEDIGRLAEACPEAVLDYSFELYGKTVNLKDTELDFSYMALSDQGAALRQALPYMKNCSFVNMDSCGISNGDMAALQAEFPDTKIVWRVFFGSTYTLRTDAEKVLASVGGTLYNEDLEVLKYCTELKYVDLGHNVDLNAGMTDTRIVFSGGTTQEDLELQCKLIVANILHPGYKQDALTLMHSKLPAFYRRLTTTPNGAFTMQSGRALYGEDPRFNVPTMEEVMAITVDDVKAVLKDCGVSEARVAKFSVDYDEAFGFEADLPSEWRH